jgi:hypothetical protein
VVVSSSWSVLLWSLWDRLLAWFDSTDERSQAQPPGFRGQGIPRRGPLRLPTLATSWSCHPGAQNPRQILLIFTGFVARKYVFFPWLSGLDEHYGCPT